MILTTLPAVGVTASRDGLTAAQETALHRMLTNLCCDWGAEELHHGDCVGGDLVAAHTAAMIGYRTVAHPPTNPVLRAHHPSTVLLAPRDYLTRDRAIVDAVDVLLGFPARATESQRSGTWYTIRYARSVGRRRVVVGPSGEYVEVVGFEGSKVEGVA